MNHEQDMMRWLSDLPDRYILEADSAGKRWKGGSIMKKFLFTGAGLGAAALVGAAGIFTVKFWSRSDGPVSPVELEKTQEAYSQEEPSADYISFETQSMTPTAEYEMNMVEYEENRYEFIGWILWYEGLVPCEEQDSFTDCLVNQFGGEQIPVIGYCIPGNDRYLVFEEAAFAQNDPETRFFMLYERTDRKDPNTEIPLKELHAYYGCITAITEQDVLVQGLESNAVNDRGLITYGKNDIAMISGYVQGEWRSRFEDLQVGDRICLIQSGLVRETWPAQFSGIAKIIVMDHEDVQPQASVQDTLIEAAAAYAKRIGEQASDNSWLEWMELSEDVAEHVRYAAPLSGLVPQEAMVLPLSQEAMLSYIEAAGGLCPAGQEEKKHMYHMGVISLGNLLNSRASDAALLGAMSSLSRQEYLWIEQQEASCVWLYYGSEAPSVFVTFLPRTDQVTEINVTPVAPSVYLELKQHIEPEKQEASEDTGLDAFVSIFAGAQLYTDFSAVDLSGDSLQGLCAPADDTEVNEEFYQKIVWDLIDTVPEDMTELKTLYTSSEQLMEQLERIQSILLEAKNSRESITLSFRQIPKDNPYAVSQLISSVSSSYGVMQIAASSVMSQLLHAGQQPIYACPKSWSQDVLFYAELPGLVMLVSAQAADNGFLKINPVMILTDEPEQIRQQIQTLLAP